MKDKTFIKAAAAVISFAFTLVVASTSISAAFKKVEAGQSPPSFTMKDLDGTEHESAALLEGKVAVILFWATWSPRSLEVLKDLETLRAEVGADNLQVIAINAEHAVMTSADRKSIAGAASEAGSTAVVLIDDGLKAFNDYGAMALPSMLVADETGVVTFTMAGYPTTMRSDLPEAVKIALGLVTKDETEVAEEYVPKNHALMYFNMGKRLYDKGQEEKALGQLLESVERDPEFKRPRVLLGVHYKKAGQHDEALAQFQKVQEIDPRDQEAGYQAAAITLAAGKYDEAAKMFEELLTEYPEREEFALGLALAKKYTGDEEGYGKLRSTASDLYPAQARYYYEMGGVAESAEDLSIAAEFYRKALQKAFATARR